MPSNSKYAPVDRYIKPKKEDYDNGCDTTTEEDLRIFMESRSNSLVGDWMREELGLDS